MNRTIAIAPLGEVDHSFRRVNNRAVYIIDHIQRECEPIITAFRLVRNEMGAHFKRPPTVKVPSICSRESSLGCSDLNDINVSRELVPSL